MNFSEALDEYSQSVDAWLDAAKKQAAAVGKLHKAIESGNARDLEKLRQNAHAASDVVAQHANFCGPFEFDISEYLGDDDGYLQELQSAAAAIGVQMFERDGTIFCYPMLLRLEPEMSAVRIDKKLDANLRPEILAATLKKAQSREPKSKSERFIETLFGAYDLLRKDDYTDISLFKIYDALTLLPGSNRDYTLLDFTRDLYFLDTSGIAETKKGFRLSFTASTVSRERASKTLDFVTRDGHEKQYAAIKFTPPKPSPS